VRGAIAGLVLLAALAACRREADKPYPDSRIPPMLGPRFFAPDGWAWGQVSAPGLAAVRYGVTGPTTTPRAQVVIVAGPDENAEVYFETVRNLQAKGYVVWVLDAAPSPAAGAQTLQVLIDQVVRPKSDDILVVAGAEESVAPVLIEAENPGPRLDGVVLWSPSLSQPLAQEARKQAGLGLGALAASGQHDWTRPTYDLSGRTTLVEAWRTANPDLRPPKRAWNWFAAQADGEDQASDPLRLKTVHSPVLLLEAQPETRADGACRTMLRCERKLIPGADAPLHLAPDAERDQWLSAFTGFVEAAITRAAPVHSL
jgi:lysophospholipase